MRKRLYLSVLALAASVGFVLWVMRQFPTVPGVTVANIDRIQVGMSGQKVRFLMDGSGNEVYLEGGRSCVYWSSHTPGGHPFGVRVVFDRDGIVCDIDRTYPPPDNPILYLLRLLL
jgi:hypothetical protein